MVADQNSEDWSKFASKTKTQKKKKSVENVKRND